MDANAIPLLDIFEKKLRLEVPMFQRQYVWNQQHQWEPLWEDISRKFTEYIDGRADAPVHFLGAMVLDQRQTQTGRVERRHVIDGQQRLTTLQIFLAAFRDFCRVRNCAEFADECNSFILNTGRMQESDVEKFKVWPTLGDRAQFIDVITAESRIALERKHPLTKQPRKRKFDPRPRMVEAYCFFSDRICEFFIGNPEEQPLRAEVPLADRLEQCFEALKTGLKIVAIDLDKGDDAQVIFETLNARGEPLLPADLLRNYIFLRASRQGGEPEELYKKYWAMFDEPFWRKEVTQGRLSRPRSDLFIQHFLTGRQVRDIAIKHLFVEYKYWIERDKPFNTVEDELATLAKQGSDYKRLVVSNDSDPLGPLARFLDLFDVSTAFPPMLAMLYAGANDTDLAETGRILESYILRRAVCSGETKAYNKVFMGLTRAINREGATSSLVRTHLQSLRNTTDAWPTDEQFTEAWMSIHAYDVLNNPRLVHIFSRINDCYRNSKTEKITIQSQLTIEHLLPQRWHKSWPLPDGSVGIVDLWAAQPDDPRLEPTRRRNAALQTFGNLTLITGGLNSSNSNNAWPEKRAAIESNSILPINLQLRSARTWDEDAINRRGRELLQHALRIWSRD